MMALSATRNVVLRLTLGSMCTLSLVSASGQHVAAEGGATDKAAPMTAVRLPANPITNPARRALFAPRSRGLATILGNTLAMVKGPVPQTVVRLRNARNGRIVGSDTTNGAGEFTFHLVEPGAYIAEAVAANQSVVASSQLIGANGGEVTSVVLKLPSNLSQLVSVVGSPSSSNAALESQAALVGGVAAIRGGTPVSER